MYVIVLEWNFHLIFVFQDAVPGGATVILEVEMLAVKDQFDILDQFHRMDTNKDGALDAMEVKKNNILMFIRYHWDIQNDNILV